MKITFTPTQNDEHATFPHSEVVITYPSDEMDLTSMLENLIIPALYGLGYKGVDEFFNPEEINEKASDAEEEYADKVENDFWDGIEKEKKDDLDWLKEEASKEKEDQERKKDKRIKISAKDYTKKMDEVMSDKKFKKLFIPEQLQMLLEEASKYEITDFKTNKK